MTRDPIEVMDEFMDNGNLAAPSLYEASQYWQRVRALAEFGRETLRILARRPKIGEWPLDRLAEKAQGLCQGVKATGVTSPPWAIGVEPWLAPKEEK